MTGINGAGLINRFAQHERLHMQPAHQNNRGPSIGARIDQGLEAAGRVLMNGLTAQYSNWLDAGALAFAKMFDMYQVSCGRMPNDNYCGIPRFCEPPQTWTVQTTGQHTAKVDLGDGYQLQIDERNSEMTIVNTSTGESTRIWGDPHVDVNGQRHFDFWGTTTFTLANGTKLTINTEQWAGNPNAYVASQVVITRGNNAIVVDGISQNQLGDLSITSSNNGYAIDAAHDDGFTIHEGQGQWTTEDGRRVTQAEANITAPGQMYGPGSQMPNFNDIANLIGMFLLLGLFGGFGENERGGNVGGRPPRAPLDGDHMHTMVSPRNNGVSLGGAHEHHHMRPHVNVNPFRVPGGVILDAPLPGATRLA